MVVIRRSVLLKEIRQDERGFTRIRVEAERVVDTEDGQRCVDLAQELLSSEVHQDRMFAVLVLGGLAAENVAAYELLRTEVPADPDWRVQEMLARAVDRYCADRGYEASLSEIADWIRAEDARRRRAVCEGLRVWTARPYFQEHPDRAVAFLSERRGDDSDYVRKAAGNALRDISKRHPELVAAELATWDLSDPGVAATHKLASRYLIDTG